jgi:hypothetical protein
MRYRKYSSNPKPRDMVVKYAGPCACCGAIIAAGTWATYYPAGTIASRTTGAIAHVGGLDGNSGTCTANIRRELENREQVIRDPGEDAADRWNETHSDRGFDETSHYRSY